MIAAARPHDLAQAMAGLRADPGAMGWMDRRKLARTAGDASASGGNAADAVELLAQLAGDTKWEVRLEVAQHLLLLPEEDFSRLAERLAADPTAFVRQAATQALRQRKQCDKASTVRQQDSERLAQDIRRLEAEVGKPVMDRLFRICQRQNEQFVGAVMHDLRGILASLKASGVAVLAEAKPAPRAARLRDNLALLEQTVNDMQAFTKPAPPKRRRGRLRDVVQKAVETAREDVRKCGMDPAAISVEVDVSEAIVLPMVRHLMLMALTNVIKNAHEAFATGQGPLRTGKITIRSEVRNGAVVVLVTDDGLGMSPDELAEITKFRPGRRNHRKRHSTGYGLSIAVRNLAAHDGTIAIESQEDVGTTVTITLPLTSPDEDDSHEYTSPDRRRRPAHRRRNRGHS